RGGHDRRRRVAAGGRRVQLPAAPDRCRLGRLPAQEIELTTEQEGSLFIAITRFLQARDGDLGWDFRRSNRKAPSLSAWPPTTRQPARWAGGVAVEALNFVRAGLSPVGTCRR